MKLGRVVALGALLFLMVGTSPALASPPQTNLSLTMNGAILDSGSQSYYHTGGKMVQAMVGGISIAPIPSNLHYSLQADISELTVNGVANFSLTSLAPHGIQYIVQGSAVIDGMVPAEAFPLGCTQGVDCTSGIPGVFLGTATVEALQCHGAPNSGNCVTLLEETVPMDFESAFLNPFGGPIFMATEDGALFIVATYTQSRVAWSAIQLGGTMSGSLAGSPVSGSFLMTVSATEDLKGGYEIEQGSIVFLSDTPAVNAAGTFNGRSTIPPGSACPPELGFPPGTCQLTGFNSSGVFSQTNSLGGTISGKYSTVWTVPAVAFTGTVAATVK